MRKKDYELIASAFKDQIRVWGEVHGDKQRALAMEILAEALADRLETYPKFNRNKFLTACGIEISNESL